MKKRISDQDLIKLSGFHICDHPQKINKFRSYIYC
jgi:hypothetical protein